MEQPACSNQIWLGSASTRNYAVFGLWPTRYSQWYYSHLEKQGQIRVHRTLWTFWNRKALPNLWRVFWCFLWAQTTPLNESHNSGLANLRDSLWFLVSHRAFLMKRMNSDEQSSWAAPRLSAIPGLFIQLQLPTKLISGDVAWRWKEIKRGTWSSDIPRLPREMPMRRNIEKTQENHHVIA